LNNKKTNLEQIKDLIKVHEENNKTLKSMADFLKLLRFNSYSKEKAFSSYKDFKTLCKNQDINVPYGKYSGYERAVYRTYNSESMEDIVEEMQYNSEAELTHELIKTMKTKQNLQDKNRLLNKLTREDLRDYFKVEETLDRISGILEDIKLDIPKKKINKKSNPNQTKTYKFGIATLGDTHWREIIYLSENIDNAYNFEISSKRLKLSVIETIETLKSKGITNLLFVLGGDLINSNRRDDEKVHAETTRAVASLVAVELISQVIVEYSQHFNVKVTYVTGNESRFDRDNDFTTLANTENFDFIIFYMLKQLFNKSNIEFLDSGDMKERYIEVNGFNLLILHGEGIKNDTSKLLSKFALKGKPVDIILSFHFHSVLMTDYSFRTGSLCGGNAYSDKNLNYYSRASTGIVLVNEDNSWDGIKIDVHNTKNIKKGYEISDKLKGYFINNELSNGKEDYKEEKVKTSF